MFSNVLVVFICFLIIQQICYSCTKAITTTSKEHLKALQYNNGEDKNPTTSYYRHDLFGPNTYAYGFEVNDKATGNKQFRDERRYVNGSVEGSYGYVRPDGSVMVTHFLADSERGYLSQAQNFESGDKSKWQENWPTKKPSILMKKPQESIQPTVTYDDKEKLNLTSILLPVEPIKEEHGLDLNPPKLEKELVNPAVLEVINGDAPLVKPNGKKVNTLGFETITKFIPPEFPIIPFEIPQENIKTKEQTDKTKSNNETDSAAKKYNKQKLNNSEKILTLPDSAPTSADKYIKSKENNAEKSLPSETLKTSYNSDEYDKNLKNVPKAKSLSIDDNIGWYDTVIKQTRQQYLESLN